MEKILMKHSIEEFKPQKNESWYDTNAGRLFWNGKFFNDTTCQYDCSDEVDYFFEVVTIQSLIENSIPSQDEINKEFPYDYGYRLDSPMNAKPSHIREGIEWLKNKLTKRK